jgi:prepilin-type N-terminal cleavage/methylation domain-containing protein
VPISSRAAGFTLLELLVVVAIVSLVGALGAAGYRQARIRGAEAAAIAALHTINQAQFAYMQSCGNQRYAPTLVALGTPVPGYEYGFVSADLATADPLLKSGYVFELGGTPATEGDRSCTDVVPLVTYRLTADPAQPGYSGNAYFGTNTDRVIYTGSASFAESMPETGPPGHGAEIR